MNTTNPKTVKPPKTAKRLYDLHARAFDLGTRADAAAKRFCPPTTRKPEK